MENNFPDRLRILVVDAERSMLDCYRDMLVNVPGTNPVRYPFAVEFCDRGDRALALVKQSIDDMNPFAVLFLALNLRHGPDGVRTGEQIRKMDPHVRIIIVTERTQIDSPNILSHIPPEEKLLFINKPVNGETLRQCAVVLGSQWKYDVPFRPYHARLEEQWRREYWAY